MNNTINNKDTSGQNPSINRSFSDEKLCVNSSLLSRSRASSVTGKILDVPLFKRAIYRQSDIKIWKNVFLNSDLKTLFILQSVSKWFNHLSSKIATKNRQLLANENNPFWEKNITSNNNINSFIKVDNITELNEFIILIKNNKDLIYGINEIDLKKIEINKKTINLINKFLSILFINLTRLSVGKAPDFQKIETRSIINIPNTLKNLRILTFECIDRNNGFTILNSLDNLRTIVINSIEGDVICTIPDTANKITNLIIDDININATVQLSNLINELKSITIGALQCKATLILPEELDQLEILSFREIFSRVTIHLPLLLSNLKKLILGNIYSEAWFKISDAMCNLTDLIIGDVYHNAVIEFPSELNSLTSLTIGKMFSGSKIKLPIMEKLLTLIIGDIDSGASIIPGFPDSLMSIQFGNISDDHTREVLYSLCRFVEKRTKKANEENCCCQ